MPNYEEKQKIKEIIKEFFERTSFDLDVSFSAEGESDYKISIKSQDPKMLIGQNGQTLFDIQHLLKAVVKRRVGDHARIEMDINDYKSRKNEYLKEMAKNTADEVSLIKKEKALPFMTSYERRIIHLALAEREDIVAESVGSEPQRKIVIKPK